MENHNCHHHKYRLKVTAGPDYDAKTHQLVPVNKDQTLRFENEHAIVSLCVRIQGYTGTLLLRIPMISGVAFWIMDVDLLYQASLTIPQRAAATSPTPSTRMISILLPCR